MGRARFEWVLKTLADSFLHLLMLFVDIGPNSVKMTVVAEVTCCIAHMYMFRRTAPMTWTAHKGPACSSSSLVSSEFRPVCIVR